VPSRGPHDPRRVSTGGVRTLATGLSAPYGDVGPLSTGASGGLDEREPCQLLGAACTIATSRRARPLAGAGIVDLSRSGAQKKGRRSLGHQENWWTGGAALA
jgi:hypothetical protein